MITINGESISKSLLPFRTTIIQAWITSKKVSSLCDYKDISKQDRDYYFTFFGYQILDYLIENLNKTKLTSHSFITTKFLDYIETKNIGIEKIIEITYGIKDFSIKTILSINKKNLNFPSFYLIIEKIDKIFENVVLNLSKHYHDSIQTILNEYKNAIDKSSMIVKINIRGIVTHANKEFQKTLGYEADELIGKHISTIITQTTTENDISKIFKQISAKKTWTGVLKIPNKIEGNHRLKTNIIPILDNNNNVLEYISISMNISDIKELDEKKTEFLNIASHELRTPMTIIKGYLSMILEGDFGTINENMEGYLSKIYKSTNNLIGLVNNMLDIAKLEANKMTFIIEKINLKDFFNDIYIDTERLTEDKHQKLHLNIDYGEETSIMADKMKTKEIFINLLGNAVKFTPKKGNITIHSYKTKKYIITEIIDDGIGIQKKDLNKIFEKFGQSKSSLTRDIQGTGLGLPLVKKLLEQMKGKITVKSELHKGSTFTVCLPIK